MGFVAPPFRSREEALEAAGWSPVDSAGAVVACLELTGWDVKECYRVARGHRCECGGQRRLAAYMRGAEFVAFAVCEECGCAWDFAGVVRHP